MNLNDLSTQLLFTTVPIWTEASDGTRTTGTAFIYNVPLPNKPEHAVPFLITNHHVVKDATRAVVEMIERDGDQPKKDKRVRVELTAPFAPDNVSSELDIALVPLG